MKIKHGPAEGVTYVVAEADNQPAALHKYENGSTFDDRKDAIEEMRYQNNHGYRHEVVSYDVYKITVTVEYEA